MGGLHCCHVGVQNKRKFVHIVCIKMELSPRGEKLFLYTNMAAMTSHVNHQYLIVLGACLEKTEQFPEEFHVLQLGTIPPVIDDRAKIIQNGRRLRDRRQSTIINLIINFYSCFFEVTWFAW